MARKRDQIDLLCESWARVRRELLGLRHPLNARDYIGAPRCTLAMKRDLPTGARSTKLDIKWPEVFTGDLMVVNLAVKRMAPEMRMMMDVHWTVERPRDRAARGELLGLTRSQYWRRVSMAREFIAGAIAVAGSAGIDAPLSTQKRVIFTSIPQFPPPSQTRVVTEPSLRIES